MNRGLNIKLYNSDMNIQSSVFDISKIAIFEVSKNIDKNLQYNLYISKSLKVLYFCSYKDNKNILLIRKELKNIKRYDKDKAFNEAFNFLSFLTKVFKFTIYTINFEIFKN